jgi:nucleotidyltransferase substrate binding protein (TIGR01987 family)
VEVERLKELGRALRNFEEALKVNPSAYPDEVKDLIESGLVQKFEMSYELLWKVGREVLKKEGVDALSPRKVFKELFRIGFLDYGELERCLSMVEDRNRLSHTYRRELIDSVLPKLGGYLALMKELYRRFGEALNG